MGKGKGYSTGGIQDKMMNILMIVVFVVAIIQVITSTMGTVFTNLGYLGTNLTSQGVPFADFFSTGGIMALIYGIAIVILIIGAFFAMGAKMKGGR